MTPERLAEIASSMDIVRQYKIIDPTKAANIILELLDHIAAREKDISAAIERLTS